MVLGHFIKENACTKFVMPMSDVPFFFCFFFVFFVKLSYYALMFFMIHLILH